MADRRGPCRARRDLRRLVAGFALVSTAGGLPWPLLLVLVWDRYGAGPGAAWAVGLTAAARMAPYVLLSWAAGSLGDRCRRDRLLRVTTATRAGCLAGVAVAIAADRVALAVLAAALSVVAATPTYPAVAAAVPTLAERAGVDRHRALARLVALEVTAWVVGPALGGLLLASTTRAWTPVLAAALAAAGSALLLGVRLPGHLDARGSDAPGNVGHGEGRPRSDGLGALLRHVARRPAAVRALGLAALLNLVESATALALLPLVREDWGWSDRGFGVATACLGLGAVGAPLLHGGLDRWRPGWGARTGLVATAAGIVVVSASSGPVALPTLAGLGAVGVLVESRVTATLQDAVDDRHRSGVLGIADTVMVSACLLASLATPPLTALVGARSVLLLLAAVALAVALAGTGVGARTVACAVGGPGIPYDASGGRCSADPGRVARPDPRGAPAVGGPRLG